MIMDRAILALLTAGPLDVCSRGVFHRAELVLQGNDAQFRDLARRGLIAIKRGDDMSVAGTDFATRRRGERIMQLTITALGRHELETMLGMEEMENKRRRI